MNNNLLMFLLTPKCLDRKMATPSHFPGPFMTGPKTKSVNEIDQ